MTERRREANTEETARTAGQDLREEERQAYARRLHELRGFPLRLQVSRTAEAGKIPVSGTEENRQASLRILYCGPAGGRPERLRPKNDPYAYTALYSPFPAEPNPYMEAGLFRDAGKQLWMGHSAHFLLKHPALYEQGLQLVFEVPEILAEKELNLGIFCGEEEIYREKLRGSGIFTRVVDLRQTGRQLVDYMLETRRLQNRILDEMERICRKYRIPCYLICGGLIGLLRDGDLIPWDDDLDLAVTRENYEKLAEAVKKEWADGDEFLWLPPEGYGPEAFLDLMTHVVYLKEDAPGDPFDRLQEKARKDIHNKETADIYVLDDAPGGAVGHWLRAARLLLLYLLALSRREQMNYYDKMKSNRALRPFVRPVRALVAAGGRIPLKKLFAAYHRASGEKRRGNSRYCYMSNGYYLCFNLRFRKEWFGEGRLLQAGGRTYCIPSEPEKYLTAMYGDYMKYPVVWTRFPMHRQLVPHRKKG